MELTIQPSLSNDSLQPIQELAELTGIPESQITAEQVEKYELAKSIDQNLNLLTVQAELDISKKIKALNSLLENADASDIDIAPSDSSRNVWVELSKLSIKEIKGKVDEWVEWAQEFLEKKEAELLAAGEKKLITSFKSTWIWKLLPEEFVNKISSVAKDIASEKMSGRKASIIWFLIGLIPWVGLLMKWYKKLLWWEETPEENDENTPPVKSKWEWDTKKVPEWNIESNEKLRENQDRYAFSGRIFLREISWERFWKDNESDLVFSELRNNSFWNIQKSYTQYLQNESKDWEWVNSDNYDMLLQDLGIKENAQSLPKETVIATIESIAWIISTEIIKDFLNGSQIVLYAQDEEFITLFWKDFANGIKWKSVSELTLVELQICVAHSLPETVRNIFSSAEISDNITNALFENNTLLENIKHTPLISRGPAEAIMREAGASSMLGQEDSFKWAINYSELSDSEKQEVDSLIGFKDIFVRKIVENSKYSLWMPDFEARLREWLDYKDILQIYVFLNWKTDIKSLNNLESWMLYLWILTTMKDGWAYEWRILESLSDDDTFTPVQKVFIAKHGAKISQGFLEQSLTIMSKSRDGVKEIAQIKISEVTWISQEQIPDWVLDTTEIILVWWMIAGWFAVYKLPLPLHFKVILWWALHAWGFSAMASILYDMWTFEKIFNTMWDTEIRKQLDIILEQKFEMNLEEIIYSNEKPDFYS